MPRLLVALLLPLSWLYAGVMAVRNWLYDRGWQAAALAAVPLINVGNLRVGGTGKTPHVAWLVRELLGQGQRPAILSRGYGRATRGFRLAGPTDTAATIGDEPLQHYQDFGGQVPVAVGEDRRAALRKLLRPQPHKEPHQEPHITAVVLDDAYQHRRVQPTLNVLLTEQHRPFYHDHVLPAGRLRESRAGAARADVVVVTKCDANISSAQQQEIIQRVRRYARPAVPVLFSRYAYGAPVPLPGTAETAPPSGDIVLLTGIAQPGPLHDYLAGTGYRVVYHAVFSDHHAFTPAEIAAVAARVRPGQALFTTQKDATRLLAPAVHTELAHCGVFYLPITVEFLADGANCLRQLLPAVFTSSVVV